MTSYPDFSAHDYQIVRELGRNREGGRISYLATSLSSAQQVVIKQFRFVQENTSWQGFKAHEREIKILQELDHPRIPRYLSSFETEDGFCMVQEYKDAPSLASKNSFKPAEIKQIAVSILEILVDLQQQIPPIIHRDIKPENVLVDGVNQAYLIDFGLARIDSQEIALSSVVAGTPGFMPPEELFNRPLTKAADLYSVGATTIGLLTNIPSAKVSDLIDDNYQFNVSHLIPDLNPDFINWLQTMVAPSLKYRFSDAQTALDSLKSIEIAGTANLKVTTNGSSIVRKPIVLMAIAFSGSIALTSFVISNVNQLFKPTPQTTKATTGYSHNTSAAASVYTSEQKWFRNIKPRCNSVEVVTAMRKANYPQTPKGIGYAASCYALAGRIDLADKVIQELPPHLRVYAAEIVFNIGHPVADAGDDRSAGPIMDLVLKYWPRNYMALYHAGMSAYVLEEYPVAKKHLQNFLRIYRHQDGWTQRAKLALTRMEENIPADESFSIHH